MGTHPIFESDFDCLTENKMAENLDEIFEFMQQLARKCGAIVAEAFHKPKQVETKESPVDLVTETDKLVEKIIIDAVTEKYKGHRFIGEESSAEGQEIVFSKDPT